MLCVKWVLFVLEEARVTGLPVLAAVLCHLRHGIGERAGWGRAAMARQSC